jgi:hypothetical protein
MNRLHHYIRLAWCATLLWGGVAQATPVKFDLPAGPAAAALMAFAQQAGVEVLFSFSDLKNVQTSRIVGAFEPAEAIGQLLRGTGFSANRNAAGKFIVTRDRAPQPTGEIRGTVVTTGDGSPVADAFVRLADSSWAVRTNSDGEFLLRDVPGTTQVLLVSAAGFVTLRAAGVTLQPGRRTDLGRVRLTAAGEGAQQLAEMVVNANDLGAAFGAVPLFALQAVIVTPSRFGLEVERGSIAATLTQSDLVALPQLGDDLYRAISHLPGLAADDLTARFWVRGAPHEQILARLDGVDLIEPFHLKDTDSSLSILDLETISRLELITGGFTAEYGDRIGGLLEMETDRYMRAGSRTTLGLSLTGGHAANRGQTADGRSRWLVSARSGFPDLALKQVDQNSDSDIRPRYHDVVAKWETSLTPNHVVAVEVLHAGDRMNFRDTGGSVLTSRYGSDYLWARWRGDFGRVTGEGVVSYTQVSWHRDGDGERDQVLGLHVHERRELTQFGARQDWTASVAERVLLRGGLEFKTGSADYTYHSLHDQYALRNGVFTIEHGATDASAHPAGESGGVYFSARLQPAPGITLEPGLRYDGNNYAHDADISPRFNAAWQFGRNTLRAAWGGYAQAQGLHQLPAPDGDITFRPAERAEHRVLSFERRFAGGVSFRLEGYQRLVRHPRPHWENALSSTDALPEVGNDRVRLDPVRQRAEGVEFILERRTGGKFSWSASYAIARAEETLAGGQTIPRLRDQRHTLYVDATYTPSPRWQLSAAWQYHTGWPITGLNYSRVALAGGGTAIISTLGPLYALSLPDYQRLDLRVQRRFTLPLGTLRVYLDVFNALGRRNTINYGYNLNVDAANRLTATRHPGDSLLPLLPSVGATWDF